MFARCQAEYEMNLVRFAPYVPNAPKIIASAVYEDSLGTEVVAVVFDDESDQDS